MKLLAKLIYWKLCFPSSIRLVPPRLLVASGPFCGMSYTTVACASAHSAKLLGTYEKELHSIIRSLQNANFQKIIDIGAAEGYYAVGFARMSPECNVIAFEATEHGRSLMSNLAARNRTKNIEIRGTCDFESLREATSQDGKKLIICDVEGFEADLLNPDRVARLRECSILVELHDTPDQPISAIIRERFRHSHRIQDVPCTDRTWQDFPQPNLFAKALPRTLALRAMNESRGSQSWFWMEPCTG